MRNGVQEKHEEEVEISDSWSQNEEASKRGVPHLNTLSLI